MGYLGICIYVSINEKALTPTSVPVSEQYLCFGVHTWAWMINVDPLRHNMPMRNKTMTAVNTMTAVEFGT